jgi:hypothetical protein
MFRAASISVSAQINHQVQYSLGKMQQHLKIGQLFPIRQHSLLQLVWACSISSHRLSFNVLASSDRSSEYWDLFVGPVSIATITTTISATPIPTSELIDPPPLYYYSFPTGHQAPLVSKNEKLEIPIWVLVGVASAAS